MNKEVKFLETCKHCYESEVVATEENHDVANTSFLQFKETQNALTVTKDTPTSCSRTEKPQNTPTICEGGNKRDSVMNRALDHSSEKLSGKGSNLKSESRSRLRSRGLIWKKNSCKGNGFDFNLKNILMKGNPNFSDVRCDLCKKAYNKDFMYISCETCNKWYHADAVELDESRLFDLLGFRCCKCRRIKSPTCPYTDPVKKLVSEGRNLRRSAPKQGSLGLDDQPVRIEGANPFCSLSRAEHVTDDPTPEVNINSLPRSRNISIGRHSMQNTTMVSLPENNFSVGLSTNLVENSLLPVVESSSCKGLNISRNDLYEVMSDIEDLNYEDMEFEPRNYISGQCVVSSKPDMNKEVKFLETCKHCYESEVVATEENHDVANTSFLRFKETQNALTVTKDTPTSCSGTEKPQNTPTICEGGNKRDSVMNRALDHSSEKLSRKGSNLKSESKSRLRSRGLIWKKNSCKGNGFDFNLKNILMKGNPNFSDVRCDLCKKAYNKDFMYISCETCNKWYHADAVELDESRLFDLLGFRCCKCRRIKSPTCPYTDPVKKPVSEGRNLRRSAPKQGSLGLDDKPVLIEGANPFGSLSRAEHVTDGPTPEVNINSLPGSRNISVGRHLMLWLSRRRLVTRREGTRAPRVSKPDLLSTS